MKKFIAMLLMGAVLFSGVVGCGGGTDTSKKDDKKDAKKADEKKS